MKNELKILTIIVGAVFLSGCVFSHVDFPQKKPLTKNEQASLTCKEIESDIADTKKTLEGIDHYASITGLSVGSGLLMAPLGGIDFSAIGTAAAHVKALESTQTRLDQLLALAEKNDCQFEEPPTIKNTEEINDELITTTEEHEENSDNKE